MIKKSLAITLSLILFALLSFCAFGAEHTHIFDADDVIPSSVKDELNNAYDEIFNSKNIVLTAVIEKNYFSNNFVGFYDQGFFDEYGTANGLVLVLDPALGKYDYVVTGNADSVFTSNVIDGELSDIVSIYYDDQDFEPLLTKLGETVLSVLNADSFDDASETQSQNTDETTTASLVEEQTTLYYLTDKTIGYRFSSIPSGVEGGSNIEFTKENYIVDDADVFSSSQEDKLFKLVSEIRQKYDFDLVVHTCNSMGRYTVTQYADQFFDFNGYGYGVNRDGLIFMLCMGGGEGNRDFYTSTNGFGITAFTDYAIKDADSAMYQNVLPELKNGDYYAAYKNYISNADDFLKAAKNTGGEYGSDTPTGAYDIDNSYKEDNRYNSKSEDSKFLPEVIALIVSLIIATVITKNVKAGMKTNRIKLNAAEYTKQNSMHVTLSNDVLVSRNVTKTHIPRDTDSGSGGSHSSSGGSSTHSSAGGGSHGGGGGKF